MLVAYLGSLHFVPRTHVKVERENSTKSDLDTYTNECIAQHIHNNDDDMKIVRFHSLIEITCVQKTKYEKSM